MNKTVHLLFPILAMLLVFAGCTSTDTAPTTTSSTATESTAAVESTGKVQEFDIEAKQFEFVPSTITVNAGDTVRLNVTSTDVDHGIAISEFGVSETLSPGETTTVEFVADTAGTYSMVCSVFCGSGHGSMTGTLIVE